MVICTTRTAYFRSGTEDSGTTNAQTETTSISTGAQALAITISILSGDSAMVKTFSLANNKKCN